MTKDELLSAVEGLPEEEKKALWHKLGADLHKPKGGTVTAQDDSGGNTPPPPPPTGGPKTPPNPNG